MPGIGLTIKKTNYGYYLFQTNNRPVSGTPLPRRGDYRAYQPSISSFPTADNGHSFRKGGAAYGFRYAFTVLDRKRFALLYPLSFPATGLV